MRPSSTEGLTLCLLPKGVFVQLRIREKKKKKNNPNLELSKGREWKRDSLKSRFAMGSFPKTRVCYSDMGQKGMNEDVINPIHGELPENQGEVRKQVFSFPSKLASFSNLAHCLLG